LPCPIGWNVGRSKAEAAGNVGEAFLRALKGEEIVQGFVVQREAVLRPSDWARSVAATSICQSRPTRFATIGGQPLRRLSFDREALRHHFVTVSSCLPICAAYLRAERILFTAPARPFVCFSFRLASGPSPTGIRCEFFPSLLLVFCARVSGPQSLRRLLEQVCKLGVGHGRRLNLVRKSDS
jgi:hypothetical protein